MRKTNKALSLILTLCMVVSLFAGLGITASAAGDTPIVINSGGAEGPASGGWKWDKDTGTLTLSGVDISSAIPGAAPLSIAATALEGTSLTTVTLVLEGANRLKQTNTSTGYGINSRLPLTIKGSGTLEVESAITNGIGVGGLLTIESGYIIAKGMHGIDADNITVTGGYVDASGAGTSNTFGIGVYVNIGGTYTQSGGYVKATASASTTSVLSAGVSAPSVTISGGYLEANGDNGINANVTNSGGVIKATGTGATSTGNGIKIKSNGTAAFSGGVTIAKGTAKGIYVDTAPTYSNNELAKTGDIAAADTTVVIAKAYYTQPRSLSTLDGVYIKYSGTDPAITATSNIAVNGGSYIEAANGYAVDANGNVTVNSTGTLVCLNTAANKSALSTANGKTIEIKKDGTSQGTLYCNGSGTIGISYPSTINNYGQLITEGNKSGVTADTVHCYDGYIFGAGTSENYGGVSASSKLNVVNGYITGIGGIGVSSNGTTIFTAENFNTKAITAICPSYLSYSGKIISSKGVVVTGTATKYNPLEPATFSTYNDTYIVGASKAMVVCVKVSEAPSAAISGGPVAANTGMAFTGDVTVKLTNAKFAAIAADTDVSAWFAFPDGWTEPSAKIKTAITGSDTDTATVTIGGKINSAGTATLNGGSIPTTAFAEAPAAAIVPTGSVTVNISDYSGALYLKAGILYTDYACAVPYTGNAGNWSTIGGELYLNGFEYTSTADTALDIVGDDTTIHISGVNSISSAKTVAVNRDKPGMLSIVGSGTLNSTTTGSTSGNRYGFYNQGGLTVGSGVTLNCVGGDSTGGNSDGLVIGGQGLTTSLIIETGATVSAKAGTAKEDSSHYSSGSRLFEKSATINGSFYATGKTYAIFTATGFSLNPGEGVIVKAHADYDTAPTEAYVAANVATYKTVKAYVPMAKVADVTVSGYTGEAITSTDVEITLEGYAFADSLTGTDGWITNLPAGLTQAATRTDATHAKITITGTPTAASAEELAITIPDASIDVDNNVTVAANANAVYNIVTAPDSWVGADRFFYNSNAFAPTDSTVGDWTWDAASKTLTLSGVDATMTGKDGIHLHGVSGDNVTLVLEGTSRVATTSDTGKHAINTHDGNLTIKGSGTLEATANNRGNGIQASTLTIDSGHITATGVNSGIQAHAVIVNGGYVLSTGTTYGIMTADMTDPVKYEQTGGYVKAVATGTNSSGIQSGNADDKPVIISGGYLEVKAVTAGMRCGSITNSGGVIKVAEGAANGIMASSSEFTGGVTIASGTTKAVTSTNITSGNNEKYWTLTSGVASEETEIPGGGITGTSVVFAKSVTAPQEDSNGLITLDGVYLYSSTAAALDTKHDGAYYNVAVSGGSYLETTGNYPVITTELFNPTHSLTINGTLVCKGTSQGMLVSGDTVKVSKNATLYISTTGLALNAKTSIENSGNLISESTADSGVRALGELTVANGYIYSAGAGTSGYGVSAEDLIVTGGYVTAVSENDDGLDIDSPDTMEVSGSGVVTSVGAKGYFSLAAAVAVVTGATEKYKPLSETTYADSTYKVGETAAKVLLFKADGPSLEIADGSFEYSAGKNFKDFRVTGSGWDINADATITFNGIAQPITQLDPIDGSVSFYYNIDVGGLDVGSYPISISANYNGEPVTATNTVTITKANYPSAATKTVYILTGQPDKQTGTITAADFFKNSVKDGEITSISVAPIALEVLDSELTLATGTLSYESLANLEDVGLKDEFELTIKSKNYNDITATLVFETAKKVVEDSEPTTTTISVKTNNSKGGTITGLGYNNVPIGGKLTIKIKPNTGYVIDDVIIDGVSVGAVDSYTFRRVRGDHDVVVKFRQILSLDSLAAGELAVLDFYDVSFKDVFVPDWFYDYVMDLARGGVINGYPDGTYRPGENVTWGEALTLIMKAAGYPTSLAEEGQHWASGNMRRAINMGLIDGAVELDKAITRAELADLAAKAIKATGTGENPFDDETTFAAIALYEAGIITGSLDNGKLLFRGADNLTRAEAAAIVWRIYNK